MDDLVAAIAEFVLHTVRRHKPKRRSLRGIYYAGFVLLWAVGLFVGAAAIWSMATSGDWKMSRRCLVVIGCLAVLAVGLIVVRMRSEMRQRQ